MGLLISASICLGRMIEGNIARTVEKVGIGTSSVLTQTNPSSVSVTYVNLMALSMTALSAPTELYIAATVAYTGTQRKIVSEKLPKTTNQSKNLHSNFGKTRNPKSLITRG